MLRMVADIYQTTNNDSDVHPDDKNREQYPRTGEREKMKGEKRSGM
jgi:hypothetical protein